MVIDSKYLDDNHKKILKLEYRLVGNSDIL